MINMIMNIIIINAAIVIGFGLFGTECDDCAEINANFVLNECEDCDTVYCGDCVDNFYECCGCGGYVCCRCVNSWRGDEYCDDCYVFPHDC